MYKLDVYEGPGGDLAGRPWTSFGSKQQIGAGGKLLRSPASALFWGGVGWGGVGWGGVGWGWGGVGRGGEGWGGVGWGGWGGGGIFTALGLAQGDYLESHFDH